jgi:hypothetical protein
MSLALGHLKATNFEPRFHGNGFVQIYLNANQRLHVWTPELPVVEGNNATIHDHIWNLQSTVLSGRIGHRTYKKVNGRTHDLYEIDQARVRNNQPDPFKWSAQCSFNLTGDYTLVEGTDYMFSAGEFHESNAVQAATLITKGPDIIRYPRVVCPAGVPPTQAFAEVYQPPKDQLWKAIEEAIRRMDFEAQGLILEAINTQ